MIGSSLAAALLHAAPVSPQRDTARQWALDELSRKEYADARPGLLTRGVEELLQALQRLLDRTPGNPSTPIAVVVGVVLVAAVILVARLVAGPVRQDSRRRGAGGDVFGTSRSTAAEHRAAAGDAAAAGRWTEAVQEAFRAVARSLDERGLVDATPGRTAEEIAIAAGPAFPACAAPLRSAARAFDDVTYGDRPGTREAFTAIQTLDGELARATPDLAMAS